MRFASRIGLCEAGAGEDVLVSQTAQMSIKKSLGSVALSGLLDIAAPVPDQVDKQRWKHEDEPLF